MLGSFLKEASEWVSSALNEVEQVLSAPVDDPEGSTAEQLPLYSQPTASDTGYSLGRTLLATTVRILSVSPLEAFNHAKTVVETKLVNLHLLASDVAQAAVEVSQSATKQVLAGNFSHAIDLIREHSETLIDWFHFSEFQQKLLREFSFILLGNLILLLLAWRVYGGRISARFLRSRDGGRRVIEDLRKSVSELQLPEDYNFKYK